MAGMNPSKVSLQILLLDRRPADGTLLGLQYHGSTRLSSPKKHIGCVASMRRTLSLMALACGIDMLAVNRTRESPLHDWLSVRFFVAQRPFVVTASLTLLQATLLSL